MNVKYLRRIQRAILEHPSQFQMDTLFDNHLDDQIKLPKKVGGCGTAACIAGWALHLHGRCKTLATTTECMRTTTSENARTILGLTSDQYDRLCFAPNWPEPFRSRNDNAKTARTQAKNAVARIEHFIKTKGAE